MFSTSPLNEDECCDFEDNQKIDAGSDFDYNDEDEVPPSINSVRKVKSSLMEGYDYDDNDEEDDDDILIDQ